MRISPPFEKPVWQYVGHSWANCKKNPNIHNIESKNEKQGAKVKKAEYHIKKNHNSDIITSQENPRNMTIESEKNCNASEVSNMV